MKIRILLTALLVSTISVSCGETRNKLEDTIYKPLALVSKIKSVQPMTGIVLWTDNPKNNTDAVALEYSYMLYKDIVKVRAYMTGHCLTTFWKLWLPENTILYFVSGMCMWVTEKVPCLNIYVIYPITKKPSG